MLMAWCPQAASHYLSQCWPRSVSPCDIPWPQWFDPYHVEFISGTMKIYLHFLPLLNNWDDAGSGNLCGNQEPLCRHRVNPMVADDLVMQGTRPSADLVLMELSCNNIEFHHQKAQHIQSWKKLLTSCRYNFKCIFEGKYINFYKITSGSNL